MEFVPNTLASAKKELSAASAGRAALPTLGDQPEVSLGNKSMWPLLGILDEPGPLPDSSGYKSAFARIDSCLRR